jgi:bisphosphoglycerate-dependent phosphoglycerate mutase
MAPFLARHGQTVRSSEGRYTSSTDLALTADGQGESTSGTVVLRAMAGSDQIRLNLGEPSNPSRGHGGLDIRSRC